MTTPLKNTLAIAVVLAVVQGCANIPQLELAPYEVERPAEAVERYGKAEISSDREKGFRFEDNMIRTTWFHMSSTLFFLELENKTDNPIVVQWDKAAWLNYNGEEFRAIVGVEDKEDVDDEAEDKKELIPPVSSVINKGEILEATLLPPLADKEGKIDRIMLTEDSNTKFKDLFPLDDKNDSEKYAKKKAAEYRGRRIKVLLPLEVNGVTYDYYFVFAFKGIRLYGKLIE